MTPNKRLFIVIWTAGIVGVLSFLQVDISALVKALPIPEGTPPPDLPPPVLLKLGSIIQPAVLVTLAAIVGTWLASKVGLRAPAAEAFANRKPIWPELRTQIIPGAIAGVLAGFAIVAAWFIAKPFLPIEFITRAEEFNTFIPPAVRMLYGGLTEEVLLRWGLMTLLVWLQWRIIQRNDDPPRGVFVIAAIVVSAVVFGMGHLPIASLLGGGLTVPIVLYVVTANALFGIVAGFLYWRRGLEAAMIAHMFAHVVLITALYFGA